MKIYIVVKAGLEEMGTLMLASVERAFTDKARAAEYIKGLPAVWRERLGDLDYNCERSVIEVDLE